MAAHTLDTTGYSSLERTVELGDGPRARQHRERDRERRTPAVRKQFLETRVSLAKRAKKVIADPQWSKKRAAAVAALAAAQAEFGEANKPFERLKAATIALHNAQFGSDRVEAELRAALIPLGKEADVAADFILSDIVGELQNALDEAFRSRASNAESARKTLKAAMKTAAELPYRFTGSWAKWESILASLQKIAHSRGTDMADSEQWDSEIIFEPVETDGAGR